MGFLSSQVKHAKNAPSGVPAASTHEAIVAGFRVSEVNETAAGYGVSPVEMAARVGVSRSTFHRKQKKNALLSSNESDALARHAALLKRAILAFDGDRGAARQWMGSRQMGLGNAIPIDLAQTTVGFREVEKLLTCINHGVYA